MDAHTDQIALQKQVLAAIFCIAALHFINLHVFPVLERWCVRVCVCVCVCVCVPFYRPHH